MTKTPESDTPDSLEATVDAIKQMPIPYRILQHALGEMQTILQFGGLAGILRHPKHANVLIESIRRTDEEMSKTAGEAIVQSWGHEHAPSIAATIAAQRKELGDRAAECVSYAYREAAVEAYMIGHPDIVHHLYPKALKAMQQIDGVDGNDVIELTQRMAKHKKTSPKYELVQYYLGQVLDEANIDDELRNALQKEEEA